MTVRIFSATFASALVLLACSRPAVSGEDAAEKVKAAIASGEFAVAADALNSNDNGLSKDEIVALRDSLHASRYRANTNESAFLSAGLSQNPTDPNRPAGGQGGATAADFSQLISLIMMTVDPDLWEQGDATIMPYPGGVWLDAKGTMKSVSISKDLSSRMTQSREATFAKPTGVNGWRARSKARTVSLVQLDRELARRKEANLPISQEISLMAGLYRIEYVVWVPEKRDILLIGPAADCRQDDSGYATNLVDHSPSILFDDLVGVLPSVAQESGPIGCSIDPTAEGLTRVQAALSSAETSKLISRNPKSAASKFQQLMGPQLLSVFGIDERSSAAIGLLEADQHMKRLALGLVRGPKGLKSYPNLVSEGVATPSGQLLRFWFAPNYPSIASNEEHTAFRLPLESVQLLSERQWMDATGQRSPSNDIDAAAERFARDFTEQFAAIAKTYPVYGRLKNTFDLVIALNLVQHYCDADLEVLLPELSQKLGQSVVEESPKSIAPITTTGTFKRQGKNYNLVIASGGVLIDPSKIDLESKVQLDTEGYANRVSRRERPDVHSSRIWWWDE